MTALLVAMLSAAQARPPRGPDADRLAVQMALKFGHSREARLDLADPIYNHIPAHELVERLIQVAEGRSPAAARHASGEGDIDDLATAAFGVLDKIHRQYPDARVAPYLRGVCFDRSREYGVRREAAQLRSRLPHADLPGFYVEILRDCHDLVNPVISALDLASKNAKSLPPIQNLYTPEVRDALRTFLAGTKAVGKNAASHQEYYEKLLVRLDQAAGYDAKAESPWPAPALPISTATAPSPPSTPKAELPPAPGSPEPASSSRRVAAFGALGAILIVGILAVIARRRAGA